MSHVLISAAHKSSGKTMVTVGLCAALARRGVVVQPFKKGPDYIDPMWLAAAAGRPCYNLDHNTQGEDEMRALFGRHAQAADMAVVEGNKGLFDGTDIGGGNSSAALARLIGAPVVLVIDTEGMTRGIAPLILGYQAFDADLVIAGVILNRVAGGRHEGKLRAAVEAYCDIPVLGAIHRDPRLTIAERHIGLTPVNETGDVRARIGHIADTLTASVDIHRLVQVATGAVVHAVPGTPPPPPPAADLRIGIARDAAFGFYYPDDLAALAAAGAEPVFIDTLRDRDLPDIDGLFIGGGFPEMHAAALEDNAPLRSAIAAAIDAGLPAYAECGGLMYLCRSLTWQGRRHAMAGVIAADAVMHERPRGRGHVRLRETAKAPWPDGGGGAFAAHEFHYSSLENVTADFDFAYEVIRGSGVDGRHDGIVHRNLLASYAHLRDVESWHWARRFVAFVRQRRHARLPRARSAS